AEPVEFGGVELRSARAEERIERRVALQQPDLGAVLLGAAEQGIGGGKPATTRHVAHNENRIAGQVLVEEARDRAGERVIAAARACAHRDGDSLAAVEVGDVVGAGGCGEKKNSRKANACAVGWAKARALLFHITNIS